MTPYCNYKCNMPDIHSRNVLGVAEDLLGIFGEAKNLLATLGVVEDVLSVPNDPDEGETPASKTKRWKLPIGFYTLLTPFMWGNRQL